MVDLRKMMVRNRFLIKNLGIIVTLLGHPSPVEAQISQGGQPYIFSSAVADSIATRTMAGLDVAAYIATNGRLPEVPSSEEVAVNGINLGESQALLLKKIEELTLYMIVMQKENNALKERVNKMEGK